MKNVGRTWLAGFLGTTAALLFALLALLSLNSEAALADEPADASPRLAHAASTLTPAPWNPPDPAHRIEVDDDGLYEVTYGYLQNAGLPVDAIDPSTFRIYFLGNEIPIRVTGNGDAVFEVGEAILFYGRSVDSLYYDGLLPTNKYTGTAIYWLTYGGDQGLHMQQRPGESGGNPPDPFLDRIHLETNSDNTYQSDAPFEENADHWYWRLLRTIGSQSTGDFTFQVQNLPADAHTVELEIQLLGLQSIDHTITVLINGQPFPNNQFTWTDKTLHTETVAFESSLLVEGDNTVTLTLSAGSFDQIYLNWIDVRYFDSYVADDNQLAFGSQVTDTLRYPIMGFATGDVEVYDIADLYNVGQIVDVDVTGTGPYTAEFGSSVGAGSRFLALTPSARLTPDADAITAVESLSSAYTPDDLLDSANGADWIAITHRDFWQEIQPLVAHRDRTYRVALVDVQAIYDSFNGGMMSAEAIRDFLAYARQNWESPAPRFVLLGGGGSYDMRMYDSDSRETYVPPFLALVDPFQGETASDNRFVMLEGDDILPDMNVGRFPVFAPEEMATMVNKTLQYESSPLRNDWNRNVLFVADNPDGGGNFPALSNALADGYSVMTPTIKYLPEPYTSTKAYFGTTCDTHLPPNADECIQVIQDTINEGALIVNYIGHAVTSRWGDQLMYGSLARSLTNSDRLSIFLAMTCMEGSFHAPALDRSLAEEYLLNANGGAVASWSPTGFGVATGHDWLEQGLYLELFHNNVSTLGEATTRAKYYLHQYAPSGRYDDLIDTFLLFGDPALQIQSALSPTAVDMTGFTAQPNPAGVALTWQTGNELDVLAFDLLRRSAPAEEFVSITPQPITAMEPGTPNGHTYHFVDHTTQPGIVYEYKLRIRWQDGTTAEHGLVQGSMASSPQPSIYMPVITR